MIMFSDLQIHVWGIYSGIHVLIRTATLSAVVLQCGINNVQEQMLKHEYLGQVE